MKILSALVFAALLSTQALLAAPVETPAPQAAVAQKSSPDQLLKQGIHNIIGFLRQSGATDLNKVLYFIDRNIAQYFDFAHMTRLSAGSYGKQLTQAQMEQLSLQIRTLFIESLSSKLVNYAFTNRQIRFLPPKRTQYGNEVTVLAIVTHPRGFPSRVAFRFHPTQAGWKIYDIAANGQSAVLYYRHKISRMVGQSGIEALLQ